MLRIGCVLSGGRYLQNVYKCDVINDVIGRNEYIISTLSESTVP